MIATPETMSLVDALAVLNERAHAAGHRPDVTTRTQRGWLRTHCRRCHTWWEVFRPKGSDIAWGAEPVGSCGMAYGPLADWCMEPCPRAGR